jgi:hypothetical protein
LSQKVYRLQTRVRIYIPSHAPPSDSVVDVVRCIVHIYPTRNHSQRARYAVAASYVNAGPTGLLFARSNREIEWRRIKGLAIRLQTQGSTPALSRKSPVDENVVWKAPKIRPPRVESPLRVSITAIWQVQAGAEQGEGKGQPSLLYPLPVLPKNAQVTPSSRNITSAALFCLVMHIEDMKNVVMIGKTPT